MALKQWPFWTEDPPLPRHLEILAECSRCSWQCTRADAEREGGPIRALLAHNLARHLEIFAKGTGYVSE